MATTSSDVLEPWFLEALNYLHSTDDDSLEKLQQLYDKMVHQSTPTSLIHGHTASAKVEKENVLSSKLQGAPYRKGSPKHLTSSGEVALSLPSPKSSSPGPQPVASTSKSSSKADVGQKSGSGAEKRTHDKINKSDSYSESKKLKLDASNSPSTAKPSGTHKKVDPEVESASSQDENTSATDLALEMGLACIVCRSFQFSSGNGLVECQDCHNLYHKECHKPPITDQDINDPRLVWYCAKCTKTMKKMVNKSSKNVKPIAATTSKDSNSSTKPAKQECIISHPTTSALIFKRIEPKLATSTTANSSSSGNKPIGLAGLAASLSGKTHPNQKPSQASSNNKPLLSFSGSKTSTTSSESGKTTSTPTSSKSTSFQTLFAGTKPTATYGGGNGNNRENAPSTIGSSSSSSSSGASGSSASAKSTSSNSIMSADKRLQIMKKKAAAKMQEKRRSTSK